MSRAGESERERKKFSYTVEAMARLEEQRFAKMLQSSNYGHDRLPYHGAHKRIKVIKHQGLGVALSVDNCQTVASVFFCSVVGYLSSTVVHV